jgi:hypothetical protein
LGNKVGWVSPLSEWLEVFMTWIQLRPAIVDAMREIRAVAQAHCMLNCSTLKVVLAPTPARIASSLRILGAIFACCIGDLVEVLLGFCFLHFCIPR